MILHTPELFGNVPINWLVTFKHDVIGTVCRIRDADRLGPNGPIWVARSCLHPNDRQNPNRATGRKVAFARTIGSLKPTKDAPLAMVMHYDKTVRRALWAAFWLAEGKPRRV